MTDGIEYCIWTHGQRLNYADRLSSPTSWSHLDVIRWLHDGIARASRSRVAFLRHSGSFLFPSLYKCTYSCCLRVWFGCHRVTFCRHRTCFGCWLADDQVRDHLRAKFKIPCSCVHRDVKSAKCDACFSKSTNLQGSVEYWYFPKCTPIFFVR